MNPFSAIPAVLVILLAGFTLYYFGIIVTRVKSGWFCADISLPTRWAGSFAGTSGFMRRNFAISKKYRQLSIEIDTNSGIIEFEVKGTNASTLSPISGAYGQGSQVLINVNGLKSCSVALRMDHFNGSFCITLK